MKCYRVAAVYTCTSLYIIFLTATRMRVASGGDAM